MPETTDMKVVPLSPKHMARGIRLSDVQWDSNGQTMVWLEGRSQRGVLVVARRGEAPKDLTSILPVRARVGYGGGDFTVANGHVVFVSEGRLYHQDLAGGLERPITPAFGDYAAPTISPEGRWAVFVHSYERQDSIGIVDLEGHQWPKRIISGDDFYMQPAWHPDGDRLAFIAWNHPQMPWDGCELRLATLNQVVLGLPDVDTVDKLAGGTDVAVFQPTFSPDGRYLAYVSDKTGWGQIYVYDISHREHRQVTVDQAEHAQPAWTQGMRTLAWSSDSRLIFALRNEEGRVNLWRYTLDGAGELLKNGICFSGFESISVAPTDGTLACVASASTIPPCVVTLAPHGKEKPQVVLRSLPHKDCYDTFSEGRSLSWHSTNDEKVHGLYYPPVLSGNADLPPAIVFSHGGPTSQRTMEFHPEVQFFTTRGYAVLQVNYRGSTGYGRQYMLKLRKRWGQIDCEDVVSGAQHLVKHGFADPDRLVIMGSSAGGATALLTLIHHPGLFRAGVCSYAVSDMIGLSTDTHKFETCYLDTMLGPLPESQEIYRCRSALYHADKIRDAVIVFHGADDPVVPREQSDEIAEALRRNGVPYEYHVFEGEGHGWRKTETIEAYYTTLDTFLIQHVMS